MVIEALKKLDKKPKPGSLIVFVKPANKDGSSNPAIEITKFRHFKKRPLLDGNLITTICDVKITSQQSLKSPFRVHSIIAPSFGFNRSQPVLF